MGFLQKEGQCSEWLPEVSVGSQPRCMSLLDLILEAYTHDALQKSIGQTELVLNAIPPSHEPSEKTKFTWLYSRLKSCRVIIHGMGRLYGKIARNSH